MPEQRMLIFEPFCLDVGNERLWRGPEALHLTHKAFAALRYLAEHAGQLVTKDELLEVVWSCGQIIRSPAFSRPAAAPLVCIRASYDRSCSPVSGSASRSEATSTISAGNSACMAA